MTADDLAYEPGDPKRPDYLDTLTERADAVRRATTTTRTTTTTERHK